MSEFDRRVGAWCEIGWTVVKADELRNRTDKSARDLVGECSQSTYLRSFTVFPSSVGAPIDLRRLRVGVSLTAYSVSYPPFLCALPTLDHPPLRTGLLWLTWPLWSYSTLLLSYERSR